MTTFLFIFIHLITQSFPLLKTWLHVPYAAILIVCHAALTQINQRSRKNMNSNRGIHLLLIDSYLSKLNSTTVISCEWTRPRILSVYFFLLMFASGIEVYCVIWVQSSVKLLRPSSTKRAVSCLSGGWMDGSLPATWLHAADVDVCLAVLVPLQSCGRKKP
jgi:hypothetical protein